MAFFDFITGNASRRAADAQAAAINNALGVQRENRTALESTYQPFVDSGAGAQNRLADFLGVNGQPAANDAFTSYSRSPGYQNVFDTAMRGVENSAAARGGLFSGNTLAALRDTAGGLESREYANYLARLAGLGGQGLTAAGGLASGLTNNANALANLNVVQGNAAAQGIIGKANTQGQAVQGGLGILSRLAGYGYGGGFGGGGSGAFS